LRLFATLERRAAALVRAAAAERMRLRAADAAHAACARAARVSLSGEAVWPSHLCSIVERRFERALGARSAIGARSHEIERAAGEHEARRRRWARSVRGLERRGTRDAGREPLWRD
jgi:hypothetical protein